MTAAKRLAQRSRELATAPLPHAAEERARELVLDFTGVTLAGSQLDSSRAVRRIVEDGADGTSLVLGSSIRTVPELAALVNGTAAHSTELDDVARESSLHPGVTVMPAALAMAEATEASFGDMLKAVIAGYEVTLRVGNAIGGAAAYRRGFHPTSVAGAFGAAVSAGLLRGLDEEQLTNAMGIAGTMASGSLEYVSDGTWTKRLNAGWAAHSGVMAAQLAAGGFTGPATVLEGPLGTLHAFTDNPSPDRLLAGLDSELLITTVAVKPYACCRYNHGVIDAVLALREKHNLMPESVRQIRLGILSAGALLVAEPIERKRRPQTTVDAQFSAPYAAAVALLHGRAGIGEYSEATMADPRLASLMSMTECFRSPDLDAEYPGRWPATVEIELTDGRVIGQRVDYALGEPENWLSREGLLAKFAALAGWVPDSSEFAERVLSDPEATVTELTSVIAGQSA